MTDSGRPHAKAQESARRRVRVYYVERIGRTVTTVRVEARSAAEAVEDAAYGFGEAIYSETVGVGTGRAWWARNEEPENQDQPSDNNGVVA